MRLEDTKNISNDFNTSAESSAMKRLADFNLTADEKQTIWQIVQQKDQELEKLKEDFKHNFKEKIKNEIDRIEGEKEYNLDHELKRGRPNKEFKLRRLAQDNVLRNYYSEQKQISEKSDSRIDAILMSSMLREKSGDQIQGRDPNHDNDRDSDQ